MFGLFRRKPSSKDAALFCRNVAERASVDAVYAKGNYIGFLVRVDSDGASLAEHFKHPEGLAAIVQVINRRIADGHFDDAVRGIEMVAEVRELILGVGVVPLAIIGAIFKMQDGGLTAVLIVMVVVSLGTRIGGAYAASKAAP